MIQGIDVILYENTQIGVDGFDRPIYEADNGKVIHNVLVAPASVDEITNELNLSGKRIVYTLAIPKGNTDEWEGSTVEFFGKRYRVVGVPEMGIESMVPLPWHKKVKVEVYE